MEYEDKVMRPVPTVTDKSNQFWTAFKQGMDDMFVPEYTFFMLMELCRI